MPILIVLSFMSMSLFNNSSMLRILPVFLRAPIPQALQLFEHGFPVRTGE